MAEARDYLGEKLRLVERAREDAYFRKLDQELIARMRQRDTVATEAVQRTQQLFSPILIPVDFSDHATVALACAADIAGRFGSSLIVMHVIAREVGIEITKERLGQPQVLSPDADPASPFSDVPTEMLENVVIDLRQQAYTALENFLPPQLAECEVELRVVVGRPFERILETAAREPVGLIILGTHGRTGLSHVLMGSVAERVVRLAPCPVLTVKTSTAEDQSWLQRFYETFMPARP